MSLGQALRFVQVINRLLSPSLCFFGGWGGAICIVGAVCPTRWQGGRGAEAGGGRRLVMARMRAWHCFNSVATVTPTYYYMGPHSWLFACAGQRALLSFFPFVRLCLCVCVCV